MGTISALGVAGVYDAMLAGRLVSEGRLRTMATLTYRGMDEVMQVLSEWTFGYSPYRPTGVAGFDERQVTLTSRWPSNRACFGLIGVGNGSSCQLSRLPGGSQ